MAELSLQKALCILTQRKTEKQDISSSHVASKNASVSTTHCQTSVSMRPAIGCVLQQHHGSRVLPLRALQWSTFVNHPQRKQLESLEATEEAARRELMVSHAEIYADRLTPHFKQLRQMYREQVALHAAICEAQSKDRELIERLEEQRRMPISHGMCAGVHGHQYLTQILKRGAILEDDLARERKFTMREEQEARHALLIQDTRGRWAVEQRLAANIQRRNRQAQDFIRAAKAYSSFFQTNNAPRGTITTSWGGDLLRSPSRVSKSNADHSACSNYSMFAGDEFASGPVETINRSPLANRLPSTKKSNAISPVSRPAFIAHHVKAKKLSSNLAAMDSIVASLTAEPARYTQASVEKARTVSSNGKISKRARAMMAEHDPTVMVSLEPEFTGNTLNAKSLGNGHAEEGETSGFKATPDLARVSLQQENWTVHMALATFDQLSGKADVTGNTNDALRDDGSVSTALRPYSHVLGVKTLGSEPDCDSLSLVSSGNSCDTFLLEVQEMMISVGDGICGQAKEPVGRLTNVSNKKARNVLPEAQKALASVLRDMLTRLESTPNERIFPLSATQRCKDLPQSIDALQQAINEGPVSLLLAARKSFFACFEESLNTSGFSQDDPATVLAKASRTFLQKCEEHVTQNDMSMHNYFACITAVAEATINAACTNQSEHVSGTSLTVGDATYTSLSLLSTILESCRSGLSNLVQEVEDLNDEGGLRSFSVRPVIVENEGITTPKPQANEYLRPRTLSAALKEDGSSRSVSSTASDRHRRERHAANMVEGAIRSASATSVKEGNTTRAVNLASRLATFSFWITLSLQNMARVLLSVASVAHAAPQKHEASYNNIRLDPSVLMKSTYGPYVALHWALCAHRLYRCLFHDVFSEKLGAVHTPIGIAFKEEYPCRTQLLSCVRVRHYFATVAERRRQQATAKRELDAHRKMNKALGERQLEAMSTQLQQHSSYGCTEDEAMGADGESIPAPRPTSPPPSYSDAATAPPPPLHVSLLRSIEGLIDETSWTMEGTRLVSIPPFAQGSDTAPAVPAPAVAPSDSSPPRRSKSIFFPTAEEVEAQLQAALPKRFVYATPNAKGSLQGAKVISTNPSTPAATNPAGMLLVVSHFLWSGADVTYLNSSRRKSGRLNISTRSTNRSGSNPKRRGTQPATDGHEVSFGGETILSEHSDDEEKAELEAPRPTEDISPEGLQPPPAENKSLAISLKALCQSLDDPKHLYKLQEYQHNVNEKADKAVPYPAKGVNPLPTVVFMHHVGCQTEDAELIDSSLEVAQN